MIEQTLRLEPHQTAVVGYGTLLSIPGIARTIDKYSLAFVLAYLRGWRRRWNVAMPNSAFWYEASGTRIYPQRIHYLNAAPSASRMNISAFVVDQEQLLAMDAREWIYDRVDVTHQLHGVTITGGQAIMYVAKPEFTIEFGESTEVSAVRRSYIRVVEEAVSAMPGIMQAEHLNTTDSVPAHLVIDDALDPLRPNPWSIAGRAYRLVRAPEVPG